jgi:hypothetical protein
LTNKTKLIFIGLFIVVPLFYLISTFIVRFLIRGVDTFLFFSETFGILGIYYVLVSIIFAIFFGVKNVNLKNI